MPNPARIHSVVVADKGLQLFGRSAKTGRIYKLDRISISGKPAKYDALINFLLDGYEASTEAVADGGFGIVTATQDDTVAGRDVEERPPVPYTWGEPLTADMPLEPNFAARAPAPDRINSLLALLLDAATAQKVNVGG